MYLEYIFSSDHSDYAEMFRQKRLLYCKSNRLIRMINVAKMVSLNYVGVSVRLFIVLIFGPNTQKIHFLNFEPHTAICAVIRIDNTAQNRKLHRFATINNSNIGKKIKCFRYASQ